MRIRTTAREQYQLEIDAAPHKTTFNCQKIEQIAAFGPLVKSAVSFGHRPSGALIWFSARQKGRLQGIPAFHDVPGRLPTPQTRSSSLEQSLDNAAETLIEDRSKFQPRPLLPSTTATCVKAMMELLQNADISPPDALAAPVPWQSCKWRRRFANRRLEREMISGISRVSLLVLSRGGSETRPDPRFEARQSLRRGRRGERSPFRDGGRTGSNLSTQAPGERESRLHMSLLCPLQAHHQAAPGLIFSCADPPRRD